MTDDAKEWVTVKVPKEDKEKADEYRPDGSTFGDCIVAGAERLNDALGSDTRAYLDGTEGVDVDALADALEGRSDDDPDTLDSIQSSIETVEQRTGSIERVLEDLQR